ncbi:MAG: polysulfide reductase NrfD [Deltaproteobacteria bacterium]|nr:polysulfide reductase NrfD [Deltaproteobacteria bacterium]
MGSCSGWRSSSCTSPAESGSIRSTRGWGSRATRIPSSGASVYVVTFVFWVGIAHAGTLISAILFLFRAKWRNAINRGAEAMTVFAVLTAAQFLGIHVGRIWKSYFILPYPNQRGLWVNFKSPLLWDTFAIGTYATISILFLYVGLIPDIAIARDRATGWKKALYTVLSLGWVGSSSQWKAHNRSVLHLSGLATPLVLSVHSVVSWDFAVSIVPGWHTTIFAPYFVAGAIFSGFAMVLTLMIPVRRIFGLEAYITDYHFENMSRFILLTSIICGYAYASEYFISWYSGVEPEQTAFWLRAFGPYWISTWVMIIFNAVLPQLLWFKKLRVNVPFLFVLSVCINIGMWFERYVIIISALSREYNPAVWGEFIPSWPEMGILAGSFGFFCTFFLIFLKLFPIVAIAEMKEIAIHEKAHGVQGGH